MAKRATAYVTHDVSIGVYEIRMVSPIFEEIKETVSFIKTFVPANDRSYNALTKTWTVDESHWTIVRASLETKFLVTMQVAVTEEIKYDYQNFYYNHSAPAAPETKSSVIPKLETLLSISVTDTPFDELKKAYRRKALELHPDRNNGDGSRMSELNAAWTIYNKN